MSSSKKFRRTGRVPHDVMEAKIKPSTDVLRRKLRADRVVPESTAISPVKAVRQCMARAADQIFSMAVRIGGIRQSRVDVADVVAQIDETWALFPLLHDDGEVGAFCLDPSTVTAFVEHQTMGRVSDTPDSFRELTRTDKALAQPFLHTFLSLFDDLLAGEPTEYWTCGYLCDDAAESRHVLALQLEATEFRAFEITLDVVGVARSGTLRFFLPLKEPGMPKPKKVRSSRFEPKPDVPDETPQPAPGKSMRPVALNAQIELNAVMCSNSVPLSKLNDLKPGELLHLPRDPLSQSRVEHSSGHTSIPARLGQLHGMRAVRLIQPNMVGAFKSGPEDANSLMTLDDLSAEAAGNAAPDLDFGGTDFDAASAEPNMPAPEMSLDLEAPGLSTDMPILGADLPDLPELSGDAMGELPSLGNLGDFGDPVSDEDVLADDELEALLAGSTS
jgi:flagellar motor switch protein FliM